MESLEKPILFFKPIENYTGYYICENGDVYCRLGKGCRDKSNLLPFDQMYKVNERLTRNGYARICMRNDNRSENLEWSTCKENWQYCMDINHMIRDEKGKFVSNFNYTF